MAVENKLLTMSQPASGDLSASQYCGVTINSSGQVAVVGAPAGADAVGILQDKPTAQGNACNVAFGGVSKVLCGGTIAIGTRFSFDANGKAVALGSGDQFSMGVMLEAGASGKIASCLIQPEGQRV